MAYIDGSGNVTRCFNAQVNGPSCGISVSHPQTGVFDVDFSFKVDDRFLMARATLVPVFT